MIHPIEQAADAVERELADLRDKLAVAVEALERLDVGEGWAAQIARAALAQINTQG